MPAATIAGTAPLRRLDIDELPRWSPWPARLVGLEPFGLSSPRRTDKIEEEYNLDKFRRALDHFRNSGGTLDSVAVRQWLLDPSPDRERACLIGGQVVVSSARRVYEEIFRRLRDEMAASVERSNTVIELGCAFATYLWILRQALPKPVYRGADWSENACTLAHELYGGAIEVERFDFYAGSYPVLEKAKGPVTILTAQAIEQLPSAEAVVETLLRYADKIEAVYHLEPAYDLQDDTLMGLLRRRYLEINDYNRDLVGQLRKRSDFVEILDIQKDVVGFNPFNALAWIKWRPKRR